MTAPPVWHETDQRHCVRGGRRWPGASLSAQSSLATPDQTQAERGQSQGPFENGTTRRARWNGIPVCRAAPGGFRGFQCRHTHGQAPPGPLGTSLIPYCWLVCYSICVLPQPIVGLLNQHNEAVHARGREKDSRLV